MEDLENVLTPDKYEYSKEDFLEDAPYEKLYSFFGIPFIMEREVIKMADRAKEVGFKNFKSMWKKFLELKDADRKRLLSVVPNSTEFDEQAIELVCNGWESNDFGVSRLNKFGGKEFACTHPIMPVERLVNIDTGEVKLRIAYKRPGRDKKWQSTIISKEVTSDPKLLNKTLSAIGVSVNQKTAPLLMEYLTEVEDTNYDVIPESKSIGRLGYIAGEGFSPYVDNLAFDGDASFRQLYGAVKSHGSEVAWYQTALECRQMSVAARIMLAASFASPILSVVGSLPFFVHLWGVDSGTGKTVALMLAASVWGDPALGNYIQSFNGTQVGQERTAAFLNHLPMCLDELQLTKDSKGKSSFDVYQLAQGVGRSRGRKTGGVDAVPTWDCCFLTTGESPLTSLSSGAGAVNRVIDIECTTGSVAIRDGHRVAGALKQNYGWAGQIFVDKLYSSEKIQDEVRAVYQDFFKELCNGDSTEKQAMAAAAVLTADLMATAWIFKDDNMLTVDEIKEFLASKAAVSAGARAYDWIGGWVSSNSNRFYSDRSELAPPGEVYGKIEDGYAYIISTVFDKAAQDAGYSPAATKSYLKSSGLLLLRGDGRGATIRKRICPTIISSCIAIKMQSDEEYSVDYAEEIL